MVSRELELARRCAKTAQLHMKHSPLARKFVDKRINHMIVNSFYTKSQAKLGSVRFDDVNGQVMVEPLVEPPKSNLKLDGCAFCVLYQSLQIAVGVRYLYQTLTFLFNVIYGS